MDLIFFLIELFIELARAILLEVAGSCIAELLGKRIRRTIRRRRHEKSPEPDIKRDAADSNSATETA
jgi:hypothetical protein